MVSEPLIASCFPLAAGLAGGGAVGAPAPSSQPPRRTRPTSAARRVFQLMVLTYLLRTYRARMLGGRAARENGVNVDAGAFKTSEAPVKGASQEPDGPRSRSVEHAEDRFH